MEAYISIIAKELSITEAQIIQTAALLGDDCTVPFIARYRKELTGSLDEVAITAIRDRLQQLAELDKRREAIVKSLEERELLNDALHKKILAAETLAKLEDIYLPFRPRRRTRATIAREKGLEPLAELLVKQGPSDPEADAAAFISDELGVASATDALQGARDIIAEQVSEDEQARAALRKLFFDKAVLRAKVLKGKEDAAAKFRDYFAWEEPAAKAPSHRVLAIRRGEALSLLSMRIQPDEAEALVLLEKKFVTADNAAAEQVRTAVHDSYRRLLALSLETELRMATRQRADEEAIRVFAENLRQLLMASPLGQKRVLAIDPGFRTGCKVVCLDEQGKLLHHDAIFPHLSRKQTEAAAAELKRLCAEHRVACIAIGNGTAGRETETFVRGIELPQKPAIVMVNESGASIYSASAVAREEFPDHDVTVRGAVSIGRRLMDPLAELVKIDPKSIGVGQYQHDVDQKLLQQKLDDVVMSCVNAVGVEVNTASPELLAYVSGLGPKLAGAIVAHRNAHGPFATRAALLNVSGLGPRAFEQCAGFLRVRESGNPLDASAVHPESYCIVERMAADLGCSIRELIRAAGFRKKIRVEQYVTDEVGLPTLTDIMQELARPGRDPRERFETFSYDERVHAIEDLQPGMHLPGIVTNITNFGAFVDVGVHQDGLVHISQLADRFVKKPADIVKLQQHVQVTVLEIDIPRKRISLSMKQSAQAD